MSLLCSVSEEGTPYFIICPHKLFYGKIPNSGVDCPRSEEFEGVIRFDISPHRKEDFNRLLHFARITPGNRFKELGESTLVSRQIKSKLPYDVLLFRCERLRRRVVEDILR